MNNDNKTGIRSEQIPFVMVNKAFLGTEEEFTDKEKLVYVMLMYHVNINEPSKGVFPSIDTLCRLTGLKSENTVIKALKGLEQKGMIIKTKTFKKNNMKWKNEYVVRNYESARGLHTEEFIPAEEKKIVPPYGEIIAYLNEKAGRRFKVTKDHKDFINGRWNEGFRLEDFKYVIDVKVVEWKGDPENDQYLQPSTLFRPSKFQGYLNQDMDKTLQKRAIRDANNAKLRSQLAKQQNESEALRQIKNAEKHSQDNDGIVEHEGKKYNTKDPIQYKALQRAMGLIS